MVVWNTLNVGKGGEVTVLAKAHTDVDIQTMKVAFFDDTRYPPLSVPISGFGCACQSISWPEFTMFVYNLWIFAVLSDYGKNLKLTTCCVWTEVLGKQ